MTIEVPISILFDPTSSSSGKFYMAVEHTTCFFALYGANTASAKGSTTKKNSLSEIQNLVQEKLRKNYRRTTQDQVSKAAFTNIVSIIRKSLGLSENTAYQVMQKGDHTVLRFNTSQTSQTPQSGKTPEIPKTRKLNYKIWL
jgi:hypothetical protein